MRIIKRIGLVVFILLVIGVAGFVVWGETPAKPMPEALEAARRAGLPGGRCGYAPRPAPARICKGAIL